MEYFNNILCVSGAEIIRAESNPKGIISKDLWDKWVKNGVSVVRRGCMGKPALIDFNTIPMKYRTLIEQAFGSPTDRAVVKPFKDKIIGDAAAVTFYSDYRLADGRELTPAAQREYAANASVFNAIKEIREQSLTSRKAFGAPLTKFWAKALMAVNNVRSEVCHTLPAAETPLKRKFDRYLQQGYEGLVSGKYCNDNSRKVTAALERLLKSLYTMPNKPFSADVQTLYLRFLKREIQVFDPHTGELFVPEDYMKNGQPLEISRITVWNVLNQPNNRMIVDKVRSGAHRFNSTSRPHHLRHLPEYSFSKISMDDRDLPRLATNGQRVKAYYAYDVASGCVIGRAYSMNKDEALFIDCMQDTFRLIEREGFGMPQEVEVENHLVNKFFDQLEIMFPFLRVCNPGNSQEKHAEHLNRAKKYGIEKKIQTGIGRWWSKHEAYTVDRDKQNDEFVEKSFTQERLVADDIEACRQFNDQLHPKQKKYPGKTRWQVLVENMNPNVRKVNKALVYRGIGDRTVTTINRNQYVTVQHEKYQLPNVAVLEMLQPNNYSVEAFYLPDADGLIPEVYLYQNGRFLCKAEKIVTYNTAKSEWTPKDQEAYTNQAKYVAQFDSRAKKGKQDLAKIAIIETETINKAFSQPVTIVEEQVVKEETIENLLQDYDPNEYARRALDNL